MFKCNIGKKDKYIRIIIGVVIIALGIIFNHWFWMLGLIPIATVFTGRCFLYYPFKIVTTKNDEPAVPEQKSKK